MEKKRYGQWAGNPKGFAEDKNKCVKKVWDGWCFYQCNGTRGGKRYG